MQRDNLFGTNQFARTAAWPKGPGPTGLTGGPWLAAARAAHLRLQQPTRLVSAALRFGTESK